MADANIWRSALHHPTLAGCPNCQSGFVFICQSAVTGCQAPCDIPQASSDSSSSSRVRALPQALQTGLLGCAAKLHLYWELLAALA